MGFSVEMKTESRDRRREGCLIISLMNRRNQTRVCGFQTLDVVFPKDISRLFIAQKQENKQD